jgi:hypothetical protein
MPTKPATLERIKIDFKNAVIKQVVTLECSFRGCEESTTNMLTLGYADGKWNVYGLCEEHTMTVKAQHAAALGSPIRQGCFFY